MIDSERYYKYSTLYDLAYHDEVNGNCDGKIDITVIDSLSGADVAPVRHGEWIHKNGEMYCSVCGGEALMDEVYYKSPYCPDCGAKMDGGKK